MFPFQDYRVVDVNFSAQGVQVDNITTISKRSLVCFENTDSELGSSNDAAAIVPNTDSLPVNKRYTPDIFRFTRDSSNNYTSEGSSIIFESGTIIRRSTIFGTSSQLVGRLHIFELPDNV